VSGGLNIDLHTHSNCSDGALTPKLLVARAAQIATEEGAIDLDTAAGPPGSNLSLAKPQPPWLTRELVLKSVLLPRTALQFRSS